MLKRWICAGIVLLFAGALWYTAFTADDPEYAPSSGEEEAAVNTYSDGSLTLWYSDDTLTEYLSSVALSFQQ